MGPVVHQRELGWLWAQLSGSGLSCCLEEARDSSLRLGRRWAQVLARLQERKWPERCPECCCRKAEPVLRAAFWQQGWQRNTLISSLK